MGTQKTCTKSPHRLGPPLNGTNFQTFFYPTFFLLQLNPTYMKRILHFKNITFKSSYNWFIIHIHQQLRPLTANYLAMFKVTQLLYIHNIKPKLSAKHVFTIRE